MDKKNFIERLLESQVYKSIFRHEFPKTARNRALAVVSNFFLHLHPIRLRKDGLKLSSTWCMGGITFFLFIVETITGLLLMFYYHPTAREAYIDMKYIEFDVPFGMLLRNLHRWAGHGMVITVWLHMFRVFLTGSYKKPREFNWVLGVVLLVLTLLLSFTGYLLPWDQLAMWAITVGTNMARATPFLGHEGPFAIVDAGSDIRFALIGGKFVGGNALLRFYVWHCVGIPLVAGILMAIHCWRVRKDGGISGPL